MEPAVRGTFRGLHVGIDNYRDPAFQPMVFAGRDALAMHALLTDNMDGEGVLLRDAEATKERLVSELERLADISCGGDVVVITFSGHGTRTRELATYDAVPGRFAGTALPLSEFVALVKVIRARLLVVVLDCCFSGGMLARAFFEPDDGGLARTDEPGAWNVLSEISGDGRIFLGAASADEEAFELPRYRHGILTYHLLQGLMGAGDVLDHRGRVCLTSLVRHVQTKVGAEETGIRRRRQHPTFEGTMRQTSFPPLVPGPRYLAMCDHNQPPPVNKDLMSLVDHGIPAAVAALWRDRIDKLNDVQVAAVNAGGLLNGCNVLVSAPTASGKTLVGEIAALHAVANNGKALFLLPSRALVEEQYSRLHETYGPLGVRVVRATGALRDQVSDIVAGSYQLAVVTYETLIGLHAGRPGVLDRVGVLVVDEIQSLLLSDRGPRLELLLTRLRRAARRGRPAPQLVGLSAVLGSLDDLASWLGATPVTVTGRSVPLHEGVLDQRGTYRYRVHGGDHEEGAEADRQLVSTEGVVTLDDLVTRLVTTLAGQGERVLVFCAQCAGASGLARRLAGRLGLPSADSVLASLPQGDVSRVGVLLRDCLASGVAFHSTDLRDSEQRAVVRGFSDREGDLQIVVATTTLAQGVNLSADSVVLWELQHPGPVGRPYTPAEYKNMVGRAGRATLGRAYVVCNGEFDAERVWREYVNAEPQPVRSALLSPELDLHDIVLNVLRVLADDAVRADTAEVVGFLRWTFATFQHHRDGATDPFTFDQVRVTVDSLREEGFLADVDNGHRLTPLGETVVRSGLQVTSARALVAALKEVADAELTRMTLIGAAQLVTKSDDGRFTRKSTNWQREYDEFVRQLQRQRAAQAVTDALLGQRRRQGAATGRVRRALACQMWSFGRPISEIETAMTLHLRPQAGIRDPGPVAHAAQRTADVIRAVIDIAKHLHPGADLDEFAEILPWQLSLGIGKGLVPLARHLDLTIEREVFLRLSHQGLDNAKAVTTAGTAALLDCAGGDEEVAAALAAAAEAALVEANRPALDDLMGLPED